MTDATKRHRLACDDCGWGEGLFGYGELHLCGPCREGREVVDRRRRQYRRNFGIVWRMAASRKEKREHQRAARVT